MRKSAADLDDAKSASQFSVPAVQVADRFADDVRIHDVLFSRKKILVHIIHNGPNEPHSHRFIARKDERFDDVLQLSRNNDLLDCHVHFDLGLRFTHRVLLR